MPLQCEFFALEGLSQLLQTIEQIRSTLNPRLSIQGVVMTMFDRRNNLSEQVLHDVRSEMGELVYETVIPAMSASARRRPMASRRCFTISNAPAARPICALPPKSSAASGG